MQDKAVGSVLEERCIVAIKSLQPVQLKDTLLEFVAPDDSSLSAEVWPPLTRSPSPPIRGEALTRNEAGKAFIL